MAIFVICGPDNVGKTTAGKKISMATRMPYVKFPYGSDNDTPQSVYSGQRIRAILNKEFVCDPIAFQALQLINKLEAIPYIRELEKMYGSVIVDRWSLSAIIYGTVDGVDAVWNTTICKFFDDQIQPSLMFILTGKPFKVDDDIYGGEQQLEVARLYEDYVINHANDPSVIEIRIVDKDNNYRSEESIDYEILCHITKYLNKKIHDAEWATSVY